MLSLRKIYISFWGKRGGYEHFNTTKTLATKMLTEFGST